MRIPLRTRHTDPSARTATADDVLAPLPRALDALGRVRALDTVANPLRQAVRAVPLGAARDLLRGHPFGHPLHPALVHFPVGAWLSTGVLDLLPGTRRAATTLTGTGVLAAGPAALAGWVDWSEQHPPQARTGLVHAACNYLALGLYTASFAARVRGRHGRGRTLGYAGLLTAGAGALLGGHMAYRQATGTNKAEPVPHVAESGWHALGRLDGFPLRTPVHRMLGEVPVLVFRTDEGAHVLADRCSHASGPLSQGTVEDGCVRCPWHGSSFRLSDGHNVSGPAIAPQPSFETQVEDGVLAVRLASG